MEPLEIWRETGIPRGQENGSCQGPVGHPRAFQPELRGPVHRGHQEEFDVGEDRVVCKLRESLLPQDGRELSRPWAQKDQGLCSHFSSPEEHIKFSLGRPTGIREAGSVRRI